MSLWLHRVHHSKPTSEDGRDDNDDDDETDEENGKGENHDSDEGNNNSSSSSSPPSGVEYYDDFGPDYVIGDTSINENLMVPVTSSFPSPTTPSSQQQLLRQRMEEVQQIERKQEAVQNRNWKMGNWQVWGFALPGPNDDADADDRNNGGAGGGGSTEYDDSTTAGSDIYRGRSSRTTEKEDNDRSSSPRVCKIRRIGGDAHSNNGGKSNDEEEEANAIWVARTDGSVSLIQLTDNVWAKLNSQGNVPTGSGSNQNERPFDILTELRLPGDHQCAVDMVATPSDDDDDETQHLFVATVDSVQQYMITSTSSSSDSDGEETATSVKAILSRTIHVPNVQWLQKLQLLGATSAIVVVGADHSTIWLWDAVTADCLGQVSVDVQEEGSIGCIATDSRHVFVGTVGGAILVYGTADIVAAAAASSAPVAAAPVVGRWRVSSDAITALAVGGPGTLGRGRTTPTVTLLTGDASGTVKQYEVFESTPVTSEGGGGRVEQWPKLESQRLPKRAHMFPGHNGAVRAIVPVDGGKFVTASADGTGTCGNLHRVL
jgi:hypothetical protein